MQHGSRLKRIENKKLAAAEAYCILLLKKDAHNALAWFRLLSNSKFYTLFPSHQI
jgi:hypothetical protein